MVKSKRTSLSKQAIRYMTLCNLLEGMWMLENPWEVDLEDLPPVTSPQARKIALFIEELFV